MNDYRLTTNLYEIFSRLIQEIQNIIIQIKTIHCLINQLAHLEKTSQRINLQDVVWSIYDIAFWQNIGTIEYMIQI